MLLPITCNHRVASPTARDHPRRRRFTTDASASRRRSKPSRRRRSHLIQPPRLSLPARTTASPVAATLLPSRPAPLLNPAGVPRRCSAMAAAKSPARLSPARLSPARYCSTAPTQITVLTSAVVPASLAGVLCCCCHLPSLLLSTGKKKKTEAK